MRRILLLAYAQCLARCGAWQLLAGRYCRAERLFRTALSLVGRVGASDRVPAARMLNSLGMTLKYQARFVEAARAYRCGLRTARRHLGPDHPLIASLLHNLGGLHHARGSYARGEPYARRALAMRQRCHGPDHPDVARDVAALAGILDGLGRHREAEGLHRRALATFERRWGGEKREAAFVLGNLAACLHSMGRSAEAVPMARRALTMQAALLGATHPEVGLGLANLAVVQQALGLKGRAASSYREAHAILSSALGPAHPTTVVCRTNFARLDAPPEHWKTEVAMRSILAIVVLCVSSLVPASLHAQGSAPVDSVSPAAERAMSAGEWKSPGRAVLYSFLGSVIPAGVGVATVQDKNGLSAGALVALGGGVIGPSLGHYYAQRRGRAIRGIVIRGAAAVIAIVTFSEDDPNTGSAALLVGALLVGTTFFVADIVGAQDSARAHNRELPGRTGITVSPLIGPMAGAPGIGLRVAY